MSIDLPGGRAMDFAIRPDPAAESVDITVLETIDRRDFQSCPICGASATDDEHVPPESIGGTVMTRTCRPCNNQLGSKVEADLADWFDNALTLPRFESAAVPGARKSGRILFRTTPTGEVILLIDGKSDPAITDMLNSGLVDLAAALPDPNRYRLALLKQAYLAGCIRFGIPQGVTADEVRHDLIAARDARSRHEVPYSRLAHGLTVLRFHESATPVTAPVTRAVAHETHGPCEGVLLMGRVFVSWTSLLSDDQPATTARRLSVTLQVEGHVEGAISSVTDM